MKPLYVPSAIILSKIAQVLRDSEASRTPLRVYREAERIRSQLSENIALEDIVEAFINYGATSDVAFEINPRDAADAVLGFTPLKKSRETTDSDMSD